MQKFALTMMSPSRYSGEGYLLLDNLDMAGTPRKAWTYDPGERRVRRAPNLSFDTPDRALNVIDDLEQFSGSPERYDWKLVGKKEMYVPYNNNELQSPNVPIEEMAPADLPNSEMIRYELHRVWEVEATVAEGKRHLYSKRVQFLDEDTWGLIANDKYDGNGDIWRTGYFYPVVAPEIPLTGSGLYTLIDLKKSGYYMTNGTVGSGKGWEFNFTSPENSFFTPSAVRRRGR